MRSCLKVRLKPNPDWILGQFDWSDPTQPTHLLCIGYGSPFWRARQLILEIFGTFLIHN